MKGVFEHLYTRARIGRKTTPCKPCYMPVPEFSESLKARQGFTVHKFMSSRIHVGKINVIADERKKSQRPFGFRPAPKPFFIADCKVLHVWAGGEHSSRRPSYILAPQFCGSIVITVSKTGNR